MFWMIAAAKAAEGDAYGGGGIVLHDERVSYYDPSTPVIDWDDSELVCVGGQGFRVDRGVRRGGEGHFCTGAGPALVTAGPQFGWLGHDGGFYASLHAGAGFGAYGLEHGFERGGVLVYLKPTAAVAWAPGPFALELGAYAMMPIEVVAWSADESVLGPGQLHLGGQFSVLFGDFGESADGVVIEAPEGAVVQ